MKVGHDNTSYNQRPTNKLVTDTDEIIEFAWVPIHKLRRMNVNVDINTFLRSYSKHLSI